MKKENCELLALRTRLAELLSVPEDALRFAGVKDKRAITYQFASLRGGTPARLLRAAAELPRLAVGDFRYVREELAVGRLWGNRFEIVLRGVQADLAPQLARSRRDGWASAARRT